MFPEFAEMEATGVPVEVDPALMNANLDESVATPPNVKSCVRFPGARIPPDACCHRFVPVPSGRQLVPSARHTD